MCLFFNGVLLMLRQRSAKHSVKALSSIHPGHRSKKIDIQAMLIHLIYKRDLPKNLDTTIEHCPIDVKDYS
jgi:hypothetical protein